MMDRIVWEQPRSNTRVTLVTAQVMLVFVSLFVLVSVYFFISFFFFFLFSFVCLFLSNNGFRLIVYKYTIVFNHL